MTRLKDALEKAARTPGGDGTAMGQFSVPPQVVPDVWQFDVDAAPPTAAVEHRTDREPERRESIQASVAALHVARDSRRDHPGGEVDFWSTYPFGSRAVGKVVVGSGAHAGLIEQYRRLGAALHHHQLETNART